jgi:hypothetical protein
MRGWPDEGKIVYGEDFDVFLFGGAEGRFCGGFSENAVFVMVLLW